MRNEKGQAAIFVALMFNVLFVFFAMAINVALVVHDKINLQNSVDLAAYYAAERQAEILNAIAQQNYAIRQSWKLLTWRYRVLGTMGMDRSGVAHPVWTGDASETPYAQAVSPAVCVTYKPTWIEVARNENLCNVPNLRIPPLPQVQVVAGFLGINTSLAALSSYLKNQFAQACEKHGAYNWWWSMSILHSFRIDQRNRKQIIKYLAANLSNPSGDFLDLDGNSVLEGARKTFLKNLTFSNRARYTGNFEMFNSMKGVDPEKWLSEIKISPTILYTDVSPGDGCNADPQPIANLPQRPAAVNFLMQDFPAGLGGRELEPWKEDRFSATSDFQFSMGVEKNPWYMAYVGVKAEATPRQIFMPLGDGVLTVARAFAKPFGGRIGPWNKATWQRGAANSEGAETDILLPPRVLPNQFINPNDRRRLPNYSRFPGDQLGMISKLAQNGLSNLANLGVSFDYYKNIKRDLTFGAPNDILAYDERENKVPDVRNYEIAAITPDLYDITYYSIEPNFSENYWKRLDAAKGKFGIPGDIPLRPDLGYRAQVVNSFSVQDQISTSDSKNLRRSDAFYFVRDKKHLLTDWVPGDGNYNYAVAQSYKYFGECALQDDRFKVFNPGSCIAGGGRTGYSVKLVSRNYLLSTDLPLGGEGSSPNSILNPPDASNGW